MQIFFLFEYIKDKQLSLMSYSTLAVNKEHLIFCNIDLFLKTQRILYE